MADPLPDDWMWDESFIYDAAGDALPARDYILLREAAARKAALLEAAEWFESQHADGHVWLTPLACAAKMRALRERANEP